MWAVDVSRHVVDVPSEGLRDKCGSQGQGNPHPLLPPLPFCGDAFLASQIHTVGSRFSNATEAEVPA